jgi:hypothetical protein
MRNDKWGNDNVMTVAEVIEALKTMPQDALVYHEGCDCNGAAASVELQNDGTVMITRCH